jgi:ADP-L-glycero-D-manno-heptose 6-epimerase
MNTWNALANAIFRALDLPTNVEFIDMPADLCGKYQYHTEADLTRIRNSGYAAETTPLDEAVGDYVRNYLVRGKHLGD